jgi:hypothetical protein
MLLLTYGWPLVLILLAILRFKDHAHDELNALELYLYLRDNFMDSPEDPDEIDKQLRATTAKEYSAGNPHAPQA